MFRAIFDLTARQNQPDARPLVDALPFPAALWSRDHHPYALNRPACEMAGFTERDYLRRRSLWIDQIHVDDRDRFVSTWKSIQCGARSASCHYRFLPGGACRNIAVSEVLYAQPSPARDAPAIWSVYAREACADDETIERRQVRHLFDGLAHEISNSLQNVGGEIDLLSLAGSVPASSALTIQRGIEKIHELANEMSRFLAPPPPDERRESSAAIIGGIMQEAGARLEKKGARITCAGRCALPDVPVSGDFREALSRVMELCCALMTPGGGELSVEARHIETTPVPLLEVRLIHQSPMAPGLDESDVFRPYFKIKDYCAGLSLLIARQMLRRRHGDLIFQKQQDDRGVFSMFIKLTAHAPIPEGG